MENSNYTKKLVIVLIILLIIGGLLAGYIAFFYNKGNNLSSNLVASSSSEKVSITTESKGIGIEYTSDELKGVYTDYSAKIDLNTLKVSSGSGVSISSTTITINSAGTYYFSGTASDANIVVNADNQEVVLVFDNAKITSTTTSVINVVQAKKVTINIPEGTTTTFTDSENYTVFTEDDEPNATVFSKDDLSIDGKGTLIINANYSDGIASKDGLKIISTTIKITSADDGIRGKDYVGIKDATIVVTAKGDGIKSTNDESEEIGYTIVDGATIKIETTQDGIQAETVLNINNSNITIKTTGEQSAKTNNDFGRYTANSSTSSSDTVSSKGLKAGIEITIDGGDFEIISTDDAIHSNNYVIINSGNINMEAGDDGIHADSNIVINNGTINITKSYEGIEANNITINDGKISVVASDDGVNVNGGNDTMGMMRQDSFASTSDENRLLTINGGTVYIEANGDGLDSNGAIKITGGTTTVGASTNGGNSALDYDQSCVITGGTFLAYGPTGMWQNPSTNSTQYTVAFSSSGSTGDKIELKDSSGNTIVSYTAKRAYGMVAISDSSIQNGKTYTLYVNGSEVASQEVTSIVTSNGSASQGGMQGGMMNGGGMNRGR